MPRLWNSISSTTSSYPEQSSGYTPYVLNISIFPNYSKYPQHTKHITHPFFGVSLKSTSGNILSQIQERTTPYSPLCPFAPPQAFLLNTSPVRDARYVLFPGLEARKTMLFLKELFGFRGAKQDVTRSFPRSFALRHCTGRGDVCVPAKAFCAFYCILSILILSGEEEERRSGRVVSHTPA